MSFVKIVPTIKLCAWCQKEFEVGGRCRPPKRQRYCSRQCLAFGRIKHADANELSISAAAYVAGLIDGEGSIVPLKHRNPHGRTTWGIRVYNTHRGVMEWLIKITNTGRIIQRKKEQPHHKDSFIWECYAWNAKRILEQAFPYMIIKRGLAKTMLKELESIKSRQSVLQSSYQLTVTAGG